MQPTICAISFAFENFSVLDEHTITKIIIFSSFDLIGVYLRKQKR